MYNTEIENMESEVRTAMRGVLGKTNLAGMAFVAVLALAMVLTASSMAAAAVINTTEFSGNDATAFSGLTEGFWTFSTNSTLSWSYDQNTTTSTNVGPACPYSGTAYAYTEASSGAAGNEWYAVSPVLDLTNNIYTISFYWDKHHNNTPGCSLAVELSTDGGANFSTTIWSTTQDDGATPGTCTPGTQWHNQVVDLTGYTGTNAVVRFRAASGGAYQCDTGLDLIVTDQTSRCSDADVATLTTTNPTASSTVSGTVTVQAQVGVETAPATMTGMVVNIAGSTGCNVTNGAMTWNAGTSRWEYSWNTSACGTGTPDGGVTIDVSGNDPDCGTAVSATQITNVTIDNTCPDTDPTTGVTVTPISGSAVKGTVTVQAAIAGETTPGAAGASASVTITGSDACNVTGQAMTWNSGNSRWEYTWNTSACGTVTQDTGVTISVDYADPDCPSRITTGTSTNVIIDQTPWTLKSCGNCHAYPPTDATGATPARNTPMGAVVGDHEKHNYVCSTCHVTPATETTADFAHRNGTIQMKAGATAISGGYYDKNGNGAYNAGVDDTFAQTNSPATSSCRNISCHGGNNPTPQWGVGTAGCVDCHNSTITRTMAAGTLDNVVAEFNQTWGHRNSARTLANGAVTSADCIVCHLEGNYATQGTSSYHMDGNIDLRDPDGAGETPITNNSGGAFTFTKYSISYAAGSRTTTLGNTVAEVIAVKFCMKCHDSDGATNPTARSNNGGTGTAAMPFGGIALGANYTGTNGAIGTQGLIDVATQFASSNSSRHPVGAPNSRMYPYSTRLAAPYNNIGTGRDSNTQTGNSASPRVAANSVVIVCEDCHTVNTAQTSTPSLLNRTVTAHGGAAGLRGTYFVASPTLCVGCHQVSGQTTTNGYLTSSNHGSGSGANTMNNNIGTNTRTCHNCHFSNYAAPARPIMAADVHGFNGLLATGGPWTYGNANGMRPIAFMRNAARWTSTSPRPYVATVAGPGQYNLAAGQSNCGGNANLGTSCSNQNHSNYSPGGSY